HRPEHAVGDVEEELAMLLEEF
ncbi:MAG: hypothetical protein JWO82_708, partial [Akkermansiaceae bacterium]|nr:hypothetical protein [Akkermansiaceae bacterium]